MSWVTTHHSCRSKLGLATLDQIKDFGLAELKAFADDKFESGANEPKLFDRSENILGKGENTSY